MSFAYFLDKSTATDNQLSYRSKKKKTVCAFNIKLYVLSRKRQIAAAKTGVISAAHLHKQCR